MTPVGMLSLPQPMAPTATAVPVVDREEKEGLSFDRKEITSTQPTPPSFETFNRSAAETRSDKNNILVTDCVSRRGGGGSANAAVPTLSTDRVARLQNLMDQSPEPVDLSFTSRVGSKISTGSAEI